jgi:MFS family permease
MVPTAVGVLIAIVILSAIPMLAFAQGGGDREMAMNNSGEEGGGAEAADSISHITEDIGIFAIGVSLGLLILPLINRRSTTTTIPNLMARKNIFISIAALTMAAGIIHILLVKEHMEESYMWGIGFLVMGITQLIYGGVLIIFADNLRRRLLKRAAVLSLYSIGIIGNTLLVAIFVYVRLFIPPFSPEAIPVNEIEVNGILTVVMEIFIVGLLVYLVKRERVEERPIINKQRTG